MMGTKDNNESEDGIHEWKYQWSHYQERRFVSVGAKYLWTGWKWQYS